MAQLAEIMAIPAALQFAIRPATWARELDLVERMSASGRGAASTVRWPRRTGSRSRPPWLPSRVARIGRLGLYLEAIRAWRDLEEPWRQALAAIDMATLLDLSDPEQRTAAAAAREIFVRLGAVPFIARLDAALVRGANDPAGKSVARDEEASVATR